MTGAPLVITPQVSQALAALREMAEAHPINVQAVLRDLQTEPGRRDYFERMRRRTMTIPGPFSFNVTYSVETGNRVGTLRHLSMSVRRRNRVPRPEAIWLVAEQMGFTGGLDACETWPETLADGEIAVNVVQPLFVS